MGCFCSNAGVSSSSDGAARSGVGMGAATVWCGSSHAPVPLAIINSFIIRAPAASIYVACLCALLLFSVFVCLWPVCVLLSKKERAKGTKTILEVSKVSAKYAYDPALPSLLTGCLFASSTFFFRYHIKLHPTPAAAAEEEVHAFSKASQV